jgi:hypothetical protein
VIDPPPMPITPEAPGELGRAITAAAGRTCRVRAPRRQSAPPIFDDWSLVRMRDGKVGGR